MTVLVTIILVLSIVSAGMYGYRKGATQICVPIIAAIVALFIVKLHGTAVLTGIVNLVLGLINFLIKLFNDEAALPTVNASSAEANIVSWVVFAILLYIIFKMLFGKTQQRFNATVTPFNRFGGMFLGIVAQMCLLWAIIAMIDIVAVNIPPLQGVVALFDHGLYATMRNHNPIYAVVVSGKNALDGVVQEINQSALSQ